MTDLRIGDRAGYAAQAKRRDRVHSDLWLLARCDPAQAYRSEFALMEAGFAAWVPRVPERQWVGHPRRRKTVQVPLPGGYLFINGGPEHCGAVEAVRRESGAKAVSVIRHDRVLVVSAAVVERMRSKVAANAKAVPFAAGDLCRLLDGLWEGCEVTIEALDLEDCVAAYRLATPIGFARGEIGFEDLRKIEGEVQ